MSNLHIFQWNFPEKDKMLWLSLSQKKKNFLTKHELNMNFNIFGAKKFI